MVEEINKLEIRNKYSLQENSKEQIHRDQDPPYWRRWLILTPPPFGGFSDLLSTNRVGKGIKRKSTVENSDKQYIKQVMKVHFIRDVTWISPVTRRALHLCGILSKTP